MSKIKYGAIPGADAILCGFTCDGRALSEYEVETSRPNGAMLAKEHKEVITIATILKQLGYRGLNLFSKDNLGKSLERPDLDVELPEGTIIGVEHAEGINPVDAQDDSLREQLEDYLIDHVMSNNSLAQSLTNIALHISLSGLQPHKPLEGQDMTPLKKELKEFLESGTFNGQSLVDTSIEFPELFPALRQRGARFSVIRGRGTEISVGGGIDLIDQNVTSYYEVIRVLKDHQRKAANYRQARTWMVIFLPYPTELFARTVDALKAQPPQDIKPFEKLIVADGVGGLYIFP